MTELFFVNAQPPALAPFWGVPDDRIHRAASLVELLSAFFRLGNAEQDTDHVMVVVVDPAAVPPAGACELDRVPYADVVLLLRYFFCHLNLVVVPLATVADVASAAQLHRAVDLANAVVKHRISRVATWTGTGNYNVNDVFAEFAADSETRTVADIVATMSFMLQANGNKTPAVEARLRRLLALVVEHIDFKQLLREHSEAHLRRLCHYVGHWSFPAHELSNDDLVYCVFLILDYAQRHATADGAPPLLDSSNALLALVFMVRDTYKNGNPFHNFRHAADVLQACFHFLLRLRCLPPFRQMELDPLANETAYLSGATEPDAAVTLVPIAPSSAARNATTPHLNLHQSLALLVAALGHDVGHPGITNAFMIKNNAPASQLFSERSVLELYHSAIFINKVLRINTPALLDLAAGPDSKLTMRNLITGSILATDMAEHFEYIHKLNTFGLYSSADEKAKLISSLLIKCADISNVTRPLRVSSQWALVLSREFEEVETLDKLVAESADVPLAASYPKLPSTLEEVLQMSPNIHKGQIFFILTFAESLFKSILELLPELQFTCDVIRDNKAYWIKRNESMQ